LQQNTLIGEDMALSDAVKGADKRRNARPVVASTNKRWGDKQKIEAAQTYLVLGNLSQTSRITGIPEITLRVWKTTEWWHKLVSELKAEQRIVLSNKLKRIVEAAHAVVENRLTVGDPYVNPRTGVVEYKPVNLRDAHRVAVDLVNQSEMLEKNTHEDTVVSHDDQDKLAALASKFAEFATKKIEQLSDKKRTVDVPYVDIVGEEDAEQSGMEGFTRESGKDEALEEELERKE